MRAKQLYQNDIAGDADSPAPVVTFKPRASNSALAAIASADLTVAEERYARLLANVAGFARPQDSRRWKVKAGEVFVMLGGGFKRGETAVKCSTTEVHAKRLGVAVKTLHNLRVSLKRQRVIEVRRCSRTRTAIVFLKDDPLPAVWRPTGKSAGNAAGKSDYGKAPQPSPRDLPSYRQRSEHRNPVQRGSAAPPPPRHECACGHSWPVRRQGDGLEFGAKCYKCDRQRTDPLVEQIRYPPPAPSPEPKSKRKPRETCDNPQCGNMLTSTGRCLACEVCAPAWVGNRRIPEPARL